MRATPLDNGGQPWPTERIGALFDIGAGKSVTPVSRYGEPKSPFLRTSNVFWGSIDLSDVDAMHFTPEEIEAKSLRPGDLLVCEGGDIGRSAIWNGELAQCAFQNHLHRLRPKHEEVIPYFVMYYLQAGFTQLGIYEGAGNKTTIPNLSRSRLAALEIPLPPKPEQEKIATVLWKVQRAIATQDRLIAATRDLKASAMQRLFTRGLHNEPLKDTEIGPMPGSWQVVRLGEYLRAAQYGLSIRGQSSGRYPILRMNCQEDGQTIFRDLQFVDLDEKAFTSFRLADGDLLFNRTNSFELVGRTSIFRSSRDAVFASYLIRLAFNQDQVYPEFINYYFNQKSTQQDLKRLASRGVSQSNISASKLREYLIPLTGLDEQRAIAATLSTIDRKLAHHQKKRTALNDLFQTLLHKLMTAEIRVNRLDIDISEVTDHFADVGKMVGKPAESASADHFVDVNKMVMSGSTGDGG